MKNLPMMTNSRRPQQARTVRRPSTRRLLGCSLLLGLSTACAAPALADVTPTSQTPGVQFSNPSAGVTQVVAPDQAIINYSQFNIGSGETVQFIQPNAGSRVLNRVQSATPSVIDGTLTANGIVYLVNPAGVTFGAGSVVNVGGLYAAAGHISDADFASGINLFTGLEGAVKSHGTISAESIVALVGRDVTHGGSIQAPAGTVVMSAGDSVLLGDIRGGVYVSVDVDADALASGGVDVSGDVKAEKISLISGDMYSMAVSGLLDASSTTGKGGSVEVTGKTIELTGTIDASGATGGGTIHVGGAARGAALAGSDAATAYRTYVGPAAVLDAAAKDAGDGGTVVVWAEDATWYYGTIDASAGSVGDGGFVEVSGKNYLAFAGDVDASALAGVPGTVLLDPENIVVVSGGNGPDDDETADGSILAVDRPGETLVISEDALERIDGDITLEAADSITIQALADGELDLTSSASVTFRADTGGVGGTFTLDPATTILTDGGVVSIFAEGIVLGGGINTTGLEGLSSADLNLTANATAGLQDGITASGPITLGDGNLVAASTGDIAFGGDVIAGNVNAQSTLGSIATQDIDASGDIDLNAGTTLTTGDMTSGGNTTLVAGDAVSTGAIDAVAALSLTSTNSSVQSGALVAGTSIDITSGTDVITSDVTAGTGVTITGVDSVDTSGGEINATAGGVALTTTVGGITTSGVTAGLGITIDSAGSFDSSFSPLVANGGDVTIDAGADASTAAVTASNGVTITAEDFIDTNGGAVTAAAGGVSLTSTNSDIVAATVTAGLGIELSAVGAAGAVGAGSLNAADGDVTINSTNDIAVGPIDAAAGSASLLSTDGRVSSGDISSANNLSVSSALDIVTGELTTTAAGADIDLNSVGDIETDAIAARGALSILTGGAYSTTGDLTATDSSVLINAANSITTNAVSAGNLLTLASSTGAVNSGALDGGTGAVTVSANLAVQTGTIDAGTTIDLSSSDENIITSAQNAGTGINIQTPAGVGVFGDINTTSGDVVISGDTVVNTAAISAGGAIDLDSSSGAVVTGAQTAGAGISVDADGFFDATGDLDANGGDLVVNTVDDINAQGLAASGNIAVTSTAGTVLASGMTAGGGITVFSADVISALGLSSGGDTSLFAENAITTDEINAGGQIGLQSINSDIDTGNLTAGTGVQITAEFDVQVGNVNSTTGDVEVSTPFGGVDAGSIAAGGSILIGADFDVLTGDLTATTGNVEISTFDFIDIGDVSAGNDIILDSSFLDIFAGDLTAGNDVSTRSFFAFLSDVNAGGDVNIFADAIIEFNDIVSTGGSVSLITPFGNIFGNSIAAQQSIILAGEQVPLTNGVPGDTASLIAANFTPISTVDIADSLTTTSGDILVAYASAANLGSSSPVAGSAGGVGGRTILIGPDGTFDIGDALDRDGVDQSLNNKPADDRANVLVVPANDFTAAELQALQSMGINVRPLRTDEWTQIPEGRLVVNDLPLATGSLTRGDYQIAIYRIDPDMIRRVLETYRSVLGGETEDGEQPIVRDQAIRDGLLAALEAYADAGNAVGEGYDPKAFRRFVATQAGNEQIAADLDKLKTLFQQIDRMGMNNVEESLSYEVIIDRVTSQDVRDVLTNEQIREMILSSAEPVEDITAPDTEPAALGLEPESTTASR